MKDKRQVGLLIMVTVIFLYSCHVGENGSVQSADTGLKTSADTSLLPGSAGPNGTTPKQSDTTFAHRDSLQKAKAIAAPTATPAAGH